jgi:hypothetical protein
MDQFVRASPEARGPGFRLAQLQDDPGSGVQWILLDALAILFRALGSNKSAQRLECSTTVSPSTQRFEPSSLTRSEAKAKLLHGGFRPPV